MPTRPARLLCVGKELELLQTRCAVLNQSGYDTLAATLPEAESILRVSKFDLVIVSAWLSEWERGRILAAAGKTPALVLTEVTLAKELLAQVERLLTSAAPGSGPRHPNEKP
jgi:DNA-binding response OmpR family regulator